MNLRILALTGAVLALTLAFATSGQADVKKDVAKFKSVWSNKKSINLDKMRAIRELPTGDAGLLDVYIEILESDVWQYRAHVLQEIQRLSNDETLNALTEWLFDEKKVVKSPAAAEHMVWALYNNQKWATEQNWERAHELVRMEKLAEKVKARVIRELGKWRGPLPESETDERHKIPELHARMKLNARILVEMLAENLKARKGSELLRYLIIDSLESLSSEEHGENIDKWQFWVNNLKPADFLNPRSPKRFKDEFGNVSIEGHSFVRKTARPVDMEILILSDTSSTHQYWYPTVFELNKTFKTTFVDLPDLSSLAQEWLFNNKGYYYPLDKVVEYFEERRRQSKQEKIGLIAHSQSAWIVMEYLRLHPESVAFAILLNTVVGSQSFEKSRTALEGSNEDAWKYLGIYMLYDDTGRRGRLSLNEEQRMWAITGAFKRRWADHKALEPIFYASTDYQIQRADGKMIFIPKDFEFAERAKRKKIDVPVLMINGAKDPMFVKDDEKEFKKVFTKMTWQVFENSSDTPWAEEPVKFFAAFNKLMTDHKIIEQIKKAEEERKAKDEKEAKKDS
jgi:pimeloyl-ACP methyl ester carboxylesterase